MARAALLIGIRDYHSRLDALPAAPRDVEAVKRVLKPPNLAYFQDIEELPEAADGEGVDAVTLAETIEGWCLRHEPEDLALLYISGHLIQAKTGEVYLAASDTQWEGDRLLQSRALPLVQIHRWLSQSAAAQQIVVLDCCVTSLQASEPVSKPVLDLEPELEPKADPESDPERASGAGASLQLSSILGADRRLLLAAAQDPTYSAVQKQGKVSLYTHYWAEGLLTGAALAQPSEWIVATDLHAYIQKRFQVAVPAIAPYLYEGIPATTVKLAKAHFPPAEYRYRQQVEASIQQGKLSPVGRTILDLTWQRLGLTGECAAVIEEQTLHPHQVYQANLTHYRNQVAEIIQREYPLSEQSDRRLEATRQRLGLRPEDVLLIRRELTYPKHLHNLQTFRNVLADVLKDAHPLSDAIRCELAQLQQMLGLSDQEVVALEQEISSQRSGHEQRCRQYQQALESAVALGIAHSPLTREELDAYRQSLGLTHHDADQVEQQMRQAPLAPPHPNHNGDHNGNGSHNGARQPFPAPLGGESTAPDSANPPPDPGPDASPASDSDGVSLNGTGESSPAPPSQDSAPTCPHSPPSTPKPPLPDEEKETMTDHSPEATPNPEDFEDLDAQYHQQQYADAFRAAVQRHLPITPEDRERLRQLQENFGLSPEIVRAISEPILAEAKQAADADLVKLGSYENAFQQAVARAFPLLPEDRQALDEQWQRLGLNPQEVEAAESQILARIAIEQIEIPSDDASLDTNPAPVGGDSEEAIAPAPTAETETEQPVAVEPSPPDGFADVDGEFLEQTLLHDDLPPVGSPRPASPLLLDREEPLRSQQGTSYEKLRSLLKEQQWREADEETFDILIQLADRGRAGWLDTPDLLRISHLDWQILDQLWDEASGGKFGFRAQQAEFMTVLDEQPNHNSAAHFGKRVGWMMLGKEFVGFKYYNQLSFTLDAPVGHLPAKWFWEIPWWKSVRCGGLGNGRGGCGDDAGLLLKLYVVHLNNLPRLTALP
ncbi:MAG: GUN4 domain-containing protein [Synechococcales bacterium]|nr:GUN4 domain-containing protein [Synechococcales bacterium]